MFYSLGVYNWKDNTFSYGYENYQPNRFDGSYNFLTNMKRGFFFVITTTICSKMKLVN